MIVSVLTSYFSKLWVLTACRARRVSEKAMAAQVGIPPYFLGEYLNTLKRFDTLALATAFRTLAAADFELKGGSSRNERLVLALMLRRIASRAPNAARAA